MTNDNRSYSIVTMNFRRGIKIDGKLVGGYRLEDIFCGEELEFLERNGIDNVVVNEFVRPPNGNSRVKSLDHYEAAMNFYHCSAPNPIHSSTGVGTSIRDAMYNAYYAAKSYIKRR